MKSLSVKSLVILTALLAVTGCNSFKTLLRLPKQTDTLNPPEVSMEECEQLKLPEEGQDAGEVAKGWGGQYAVCQLKHKFLIWYIKEKQAERGKK